MINKKIYIVSVDLDNECTKYYFERESDARCFMLKLYVEQNSDKVAMIHMYSLVDFIVAGVLGDYITLEEAYIEG